MDDEYIELRARSAFSFLRGAASPEQLVARAASLGQPALALGDRDGLYGAPGFHRAAVKAGLRALIGAELHVAAGAGPECCVYLLAADRRGYRNLCRTITDAKLRAAKGESAQRWSDLEGRTEGLICLAGGETGPLLQASRARNPDPGTLPATIRLLQSLFPDRLYVDLQRHLDPQQERRNRFLVDVARHYRLPLLATNDVAFAERQQRPLFDVLTCIREKTHLDAAGRRLDRNAERFLRSSGEMSALFRDLPEAIRNTRRVADACEFTLADLGYRFPEYPLPPGETPIGHLRELTYAGARERYGKPSDRVRRQLEHELHIIGKLDLAGYFLIVHDIVRFCREQGILAQGRGSAANSAVCYSLGITAVDAVGMDLLFERFLSEERGEWPDIDIDLPSGERREQVIQYVYERYGKRGAAMTANVITYRTRSAVREVGKALGFSLEQVDKLSKLLRRFEFRDGSDELGKQLRAGGVDPNAPRVGLLVDLVGKIRSLPRHLGQHSGGMVIAAGRLDDVVPLEPASMPGRVVVQWDKDDCADLGIIKVDLLGLGMMAVLEEVIPLIREHEGVEIDLAKLPPDDPKTYAMLRRADTIGVFQVESRAQMATLPRLKPERFYDLVVEVALIRPGPIVGQMVHPYLNRRNGREPVTYAHPDLKPILERTLGVPLFQEQLLRMAMVLAGFTGGQAEELRRAMGFKRSVERMESIEARLRAGMTRRGIAAGTQEEIVRSITSFALYGFPESHAASFALIAYASAYLRAHHPAAFVCALLNNWPMGFYHPATLVKDAQRHGVHVLPVDITRSAWRCSLESSSPQRHGDAEMSSERTLLHAPEESPRLCVSAVKESLSVRLGLKYVRGLRAESAQRIEAERARAPFASLADVAARCGLRDDEMQTLAHVGAFAPFGLSRREALWQASAIPQEPLLRRRSEDSGVRSGEEDSSSIGISASLRLCGESSLPEMNPLERSLADYKDLGLTVGSHVVRYLRDELRRQGVLRASELARARNGQWVRIGGLVIVRQRPGTAKGMCFLTIEDETGTSNAAVMPQVFDEYRALIHTAALLRVDGPLQKVDGVTHVLAKRLVALRLPEQEIAQRGSGYRMRTTPADEPPSTPKSHDFR